MKLTVVYDDEVYNENPGTADHGFSCFIETPDETILFDTGTNGDLLLQNMKLLGKKPEKITKIVISHEHYDHNGGLNALLPFLSHPTIYRLEHDQLSSSIHEIIVNDPMKITDTIRSTGRLPGTPVDEQSLLLETTDGIVVLTGCSHSGVGSILRHAQKQGKVTGLIGGFHGFADFEILDSLDFVYPCHCTVFKKDIKNRYPKRAKNCGVGLIISLE